jgi:hypothetical protein
VVFIAAAISYRRLGQLHMAVLDTLGATARTIVPQDLGASPAAPAAPGARTVDWALLCQAIGHPEAASVLQERTSCVQANIRQSITARQFASALSQQLQSVCL